MKTHKLELTEEQIDKYGLRELVPFTGWAKCDNNSAWLGYYEENKLKYGINIFSQWFELYDFYAYKPKYERQATKKEIETGLIEMAKKMGFKEGVKYKLPLSNLTQTAIDNRITFSYNCLYISGWTIFQKGKWATIITDSKEMTIEEIQKELGYKIKIVE